jgi:broad specificity phosphatase PhoE
MSEPKVESHQASEVDSNTAALRACASDIVSKFGRVLCELAPEGTVEPPAGAKLVHFIRHGEGFHNVAQREWRADPMWDGKSEPYTIDNDPTWKYVDAELNEKGKDQAVSLQEQTQALRPQLLVVSPMRRATATGLLAFQPHIQRSELPAVASELCHECAGRHTCDKRLSRSELAALYLHVDYSLISSEEDPYWGDGVTREPLQALAARAADFTRWLLDRPEQHLVVASHSAFLLATFNAALECVDESTRLWFGTGEMRSVLLRRQ